MLAWAVPIQLALVLHRCHLPPLDTPRRHSVPIHALKSDDETNTARGAPPGGAPPGSPGWLSSARSRGGGARDADAAAEYDVRVAEAQAAIAAAEAARKRLALERSRRGGATGEGSGDRGIGVSSSAGRGRLSTSSRRSTLTRTDANTLQIDLPAAGLLRADALMGGTFAVAWSVIFRPPPPLPIHPRRPSSELSSWLSSVVLISV